MYCMLCYVVAMLYLYSVMLYYVMQTFKVAGNRMLASKDYR